MARGPQGEVVELGTATVTLDGTGAGTQAVNFAETFVATPAIQIASPTADSGTWSATSTSETGFTVTATASDITSQDYEVTWVAVEKP